MLKQLAFVGLWAMLAFASIIAGNNTSEAQTIPFRAYLPLIQQPPPLIADPKPGYRIAQDTEGVDWVSITVHGVWPNSCLPVPGTFGDGQQMHIQQASDQQNGLITVSLHESVPRISPWQECEGECYEQSCGDTPTKWYHIFSSGTLDAGTYDFQFRLAWQTDNPFNDTPHLACENEVNCFHEVVPSLFVMGE